MKREMTVSQLSAYLKGVFDDEELLHDVTLIGEVADISYSDKHTYLVLADGAYSVRCVHFFARDKIEKGMRVALGGSVGFYDKRSTVSFIYNEFFLNGQGDKNVKLDAVRKKLRELGYFENRPQLPKYIVDVTVVTSPDGAAVRDFMRVVYDKNPFVRIKVYPVKVQGEQAAAQMTTAINGLQARRTDAIVLCRGGGSDEDLDCFNDEKLATAVALSNIPVISAVGHEINYSLCDYCAGTRAGTPSIAGEIVNAHASRIKTDIRDAMYTILAHVSERYQSRMRKIARLGVATTNAVSKRINAGFGAVRLSASRGVYALNRKLGAKAVRLDQATTRLRSGVANKLSDSRAQYEKLNALLSALDPHRIIKVGYAAVLRERRRVASAAELRAGDAVSIVFGDGSATAVVKEISRTDKE